MQLVVAYLKRPSERLRPRPSFDDFACLQEFACQVFSYCGIDSAEAKIASDILVMADLRGMTPRHCEAAGLLLDARSWIDKSKPKCAHHS